MPEKMNKIILFKLELSGVRMSSFFSEALRLPKKLDLHRTPLSESIHHVGIHVQLTMCIWNTCIPQFPTSSRSDKIIGKIRERQPSFSWCMFWVDKVLACDQNVYYAILKMDFIVAFSSIWWVFNMPIPMHMLAIYTSWSSKLPHH